MIGAAGPVSGRPSTMSRPSPHLALPLAAALLAAAPAAGRATPRLVAAFDDAAGDATGPGSYVPPGDSDFEDGDFDLRRFAVLLDGDDVLLEVTLGARIRRPATTQRTNTSPLELTNGVYLQNVDVYVDSDRTPGSGFSTCIPGRRVAFDGGRTWESAVVLTPQPGPVRAIVDEAMGVAATHVHVATRIEARGRTVVARVPAAALGGTPRADWGWSVHVSGARWETTYALAARLRGAAEPDAFTMPVLPLRQAWAFGGAPAGDAHPRVVDVLLPAGADQRATLGSFDAASGAWARVPFVQAEPAGEEATAAAPSPASAPPAGFTVADVAGELVTLSGPGELLAPLRIGRVVGPAGEPLGSVVVTRVLPGGAVANLVDGKGVIARGAKVLFEPPAPAEVSPSRSPP